MRLRRQSGIECRGRLRHLDCDGGRVGVFQAAELALILDLKLLRQTESRGHIILSSSVEPGLLVHVAARSLKRADGLRNIAGVAALKGLHQIVERREGIVGGGVAAGILLVEQVLRSHRDLKRHARGARHPQRGLLRRD